MGRQYELLSMGEAVVEIFRKQIDEPFDQPRDFIGPFPSGAPAIVADTMAKLGGSAAFFATVGPDDFGRCVTERLARDGVNVSGVRALPGHTTGIAFACYLSGGERRFLYNFLDAAPAAFAPIHVDTGIIERAEWLHISGNVMAFSNSARDAIIYAAEVARTAGTKISFDPNIRLEIMRRDELLALFQPVLGWADLVIPSEGELELIYDHRDEVEVVRELLAGGTGLVALKRGKRGCLLASEQETVVVPAMRGVDVIDTTGCGDAFCAGLIYGLNRGWALAMCGRFANAVGGVTAMHKGTMEGVAGLDDVLALLRDNGHAQEFGV